MQQLATARPGAIIPRSNRFFAITIEQNKYYIGRGFLQQVVLTTAMHCIYFSNTRIISAVPFLYILCLRQGLVQSFVPELNLSAYVGTVSFP